MKSITFTSLSAQLPDRPSFHIMLRCARCLGRTARQDLATARCRLTSATLAPAAQTQARRYISSGDLDRELGKLLGTTSDSLKEGKNPGNLVPGKNKWIKSKKQPRSFELDVGGLAGLAKTKDASGGGVGGGKQSTPTGQQDRRRGDKDEPRAYGNGTGKGRDTRSNGPKQGQGQGHGQGQGSRPQGQGARFGMKRESTGPGAGNRDRNVDRQSGPSTSTSTPNPRTHKNNKGNSFEPISEIDAEADADEPVVVEEDEDTTASRKNRFGPSSSKSGSSSGSSSQGKGEKKSHSKSRTSFHKLSTPGSGEPAYPVQPGSHSHPYSNSNPKQKNHKDKDNNDKKTVKKDKLEPKFKVEREVYIPPISVKVGDLARMVDVRLGNLQQRMRRMGLSEEECHSDNCEYCGGCLIHLYNTSQRTSGSGSGARTYFGEVSRLRSDWVIHFIG
jgi:hypothetical protein